MGIKAPILNVLQDDLDQTLPFNPCCGPFELYCHMPMPTHTHKHTHTHTTDRRAPDKFPPKALMAMARLRSALPPADWGLLIPALRSSVLLLVIGWLVFFGDPILRCGAWGHRA